MEAPFDFDFAEEVALADDELVHFHQFEDGEEGDDDLGLGGGGLEEEIEAGGLAWGEACEEHFDFIGDGVAVVDDIAEVVGLLEAFEDILKSADQVEDGDFGEGGGFLRKFGAFGLEGEGIFLFGFAEGEEACGVLEFLVFDELANEFPARVVFLRFLIGRLFAAREEGAAFEIHQVGRHDDEFGGEVDVEEAEGFDVLEVLAGDAGDGNFVNIEFFLFDKVEQEVERAFEDVEPYLVVDTVHGWRL